MKRTKRRQKVSDEILPQILVVTMHDENDVNSFEQLFTNEELFAWLADPFSGVFCYPEEGESHQRP